MTSALTFAQFLMNRRDNSRKKTEVTRKALRYLMLYIIQERAKQHLRTQRISLEERRLLHCWHEVYHTGLGGNGDADALLRQIDSLPTCERG